MLASSCQSPQFWFQLSITLVLVPVLSIRVSVSCQSLQRRCQPSITPVLVPAVNHSNPVSPVNHPVGLCWAGGWRGCAGHRLDVGDWPSDGRQHGDQDGRHQRSVQDKGAAYPVDGPDQRGVLRAGRSVVGGRVSKAVWDTGPNSRQDSKIHEDFCKNNIPHFENKQIVVRKWKGSGN